MNILRKRRKKSRLIREIGEPKGKNHSGFKAKKANEPAKGKDYLKDYEDDLKRFRISVVASMVLLFTLWWVPLLGPMFAGYLVGVIAKKRWLALKAMVIPVLFIAVIVNAVQFGLLPMINAGQEIGLFFLSYFPGTYFALAPYIIPLVNACSLFNSIISIGPNGYLIISLIMAYFGGFAQEKKSARSAKDVKNKDKTSKVGSEDKTAEKGRFLYRRRESEKGGFGDIIHSLKKNNHRGSSDIEVRTARIDIPVSKEKEGWIRSHTHAARTEPDEVEESSPAPQRSVPKFVARPTARQDLDRGHLNRRTISGGTLNGGTRVTTILPSNDDGPEDVDFVRGRQYPTKPPMSRAIVDRAVKTYKANGQDRRTSSGDTECQMGHSYNKRNFESL